MNVQQLRAQIAALQDATMDENRNFRSGYDEGKFDALSAVDALLDSLQEEPVSEGLEKAAEEYYNKVKYLSDLSASPITTFKAGAEWADKTMLDNVCDFIKINAYKYGKVKFVDDRAIFDFRTDRFIEDLRKAMKGGETS